MYSDVDGSLKVNLDVAAVGLAAALLGELLMDGTVDIRQGQVLPGPWERNPGGFLGKLTTEFERGIVHDVTTVLTFMARTAHDEVAARMLRAGHIERQSRRRLASRTVRYLQVDVNAAAWPWVRLSQALRRGAQLDNPDVILGGLILATELHRRVLSGLDTVDAGDALRAKVVHAPGPVRELLETAEVLVGTTASIRVSRG